MKFIVNALFLLIGLQLCHAQIDSLNLADGRYKEDQFYIGITYNLLGNKPSKVKQSRFSTGIHLGFIKDMPINIKRNIAIGAGLGYSFNTFNQNLLINRDASGSLVYGILADNNTYKKNILSSHSIELPIEFRWRTSSPTEYEFWRIYTGIKAGYAFSSSGKHQGDLGSFKIYQNEDFNKLQYGLTLSAGYDTWNFHLYYALNPIFSNNAQISGNPIDMNAIKVGLMFYVL